MGGANYTGVYNGWFEFMEDKIARKAGWDEV
jgi:hypothetical protein